MGIVAVAGVLTMLQAVGQLLYSVLCLLQYFCVVDFMRGRPLLLYIKLMYFHNPSTCESRINIGQSIEGMPDQAFVLLSREPFTSTRTFVINVTGLALCVIWLIASFVLMRGGAMNRQSTLFRWTWVIVTGAVSGLDIVAAVAFANDSFSTKTLSEMLELIGGQASGTGNLNLDTKWAAWSMVILHLRFGILFLLNALLVVLVVLHVNKHNNNNNPVESAPINDRIFVFPRFVLPRAMKLGTINQSLRKLKSRLYSFKPDSSQTELADLGFDGTLVSRSGSLREPLQQQPTKNEVETTATEPLEQQPTKNEVETTATAELSIRPSPPKELREVPQEHNKIRRGTAAELQGQLPWAYVPASSQGARDQLTDEVKPPIPLPDYTALPTTGRRLSVHRSPATGADTPMREIRDTLHRRREFGRTRAQRIHLSDVLY